MIELKQINKSWRIKGRDVLALDTINLAIAQGDIVGIIGESGAGKSTLLRTINLLVRPSDGQVYINHSDITTLPIKQLNQYRQNIGMVFQHFNLMQSRTAAENIALPLELQGKSKAEINQRVSTLLDLINLSAHRFHYPSELSGGQKQRIAIARALATQPDILLCDEPTSALDNKSTQAIIQLLKQINQEMGVTIVIVSHELEVVKNICRRVAVLHHGKIVEYDTVAQIFSPHASVITRQLVEGINHE